MGLRKLLNEFNRIKSLTIEEFMEMETERLTLKALQTNQTLDDVLNEEINTRLAELIKGTGQSQDFLESQGVIPNKNKLKHMRQVVKVLKGVKH